MGSDHTLERPHDGPIPPIRCPLWRQRTQSGPAEVVGKRVQDFPSSKLFGLPLILHFQPLPLGCCTSSGMSSARIAK